MPEAYALLCPVCGGTAQHGDRSCRYCNAALATLRCQHCLELSYPDALHCRGCGLELGLAPEAAPSEHTCPDCRVALAAFHTEAGRSLACQSCGGQLVTHALLRALLEQREVLGRAAPSAEVPRANPLAKPVRYRACPVCAQMMNRKNFGGTSGVVLDVCSVHGSWFDAGELPRVLAFVRRGGLTRATLPQPQAAVKPVASGSFVSTQSIAPASFADGVVELVRFVIDVLT